MKTILLVDNDLGFAFWLGHALDQAGYEALPARTIPDVAKLLEELNVAIDLLLINAALHGASSFIADLRRAQTSFKVIAIYDEPRPSQLFTGADAVYHKTSAVDESTRLKWVEAVENVLAGNVARPNCSETSAVG